VIATATVKKVMQQRLTRGTPVIIADSFGQAELRGVKMIVASRSTVKCNKGNRCAGPWCADLAVFVTDPKTKNEDKEMGWRGGTTKICLTHLKDEEGVLVLPPPIRAQILPDFNDIQAQIQANRTASSGDNRPAEVTWVELAHAVSKGDLNAVAFMARTLKSDNESLKSKVIAAQDKLIEHLTR
jgi:hypothetical protein